MQILCHVTCVEDDHSEVSYRHGRRDVVGSLQLRFEAAGDSVRRGTGRGLGHCVYQPLQAWNAIVAVICNGTLQ